MEEFGELIRGELISAIHILLAHMPNEPGLIDLKAIAGFEWILSQGCLAQCFLLGMRENAINELLNELLSDLDSATQAIIREWLKSKTSNAALGVLALLRSIQKKLSGNPQGTALPGSLLKKIPIKSLKKLQIRIAKLSLKFAGRNGVGIFGKHGAKLLPVVGKALLAKEVHDCGFCYWAFQDGIYDSRDTLYEFYLENGRGKTPIYIPGF